MKPDYNGLSSEYYDTGKVQLYNCKGTLRDTELPHPKPNLVHQTPRLVNL